MRTFVLKTIVTFLLPFLVLLIGIEWGLRSIDNDYRYKQEQMQRLCKEVEVLSFGSSHGHYGIRPDCFEVPAYNLGMPSQSIKYDHFLFYQWADQCPHLRYVVLPVSYFSLFGELENGAGWAHAKGYTIYMGYKGNGLHPIFNLELINKEKWLGLAKMLGKEWSFVTCDSLGWGCKREYGLQKPNFAEQATNTVASHSRTIDTMVQATNEARLADIIATCQARGIEVLLLTTPTHPAYYTALDSAQWHTTQRVCEGLAAKFSNASYLNLLKDSTFTDADFYDADHLNTNGASKLTKYIQSYHEQKNNQNRTNR